jgi:lipoyl(octanoyl) transferase
MIYEAIRRAGASPADPETRQPGRLPCNWLFASLILYHDIDSRSAAMNMAIDEALLEIVKEPTIRFYRWDHPAVSFGYFGRFADLESCDRDVVRRWTGGGIVFHGEDLTYSVIIPASDPAFSESSMSIYEKTHRAICGALTANGETGAALYERRSEINSAVLDRRHLCFAYPVQADVMLNGQKIAGAAQRRTRGGLLQQGSIQNVDIPVRFDEKLTRQLSGDCVKRQIDARVLERAKKIEQKYGSEGWLRKR